MSIRDYFYLLPKICVFCVILGGHDQHQIPAVAFRVRSRREKSGLRNLQKASNATRETKRFDLTFHMQGESGDKGLSGKFVDGNSSSANELVCICPETSRDKYFA